MGHCPKFSWFSILMRLLRSQKIFDLNFFGPILFYLKILLGSKNLWSKNFFAPKMFSTPNFFGLKFLNQSNDPILFWPNIFFWPQICWTKTLSKLFGPKIFWTSNFLNQNFFRAQHFFERQFLVATSSSRSDDVTLLVCLLVCL